MMKPSRLFLEWLTCFLHSIAILPPRIKCLLKSRKNMLQERRCLFVVKERPDLCTSVSGTTLRPLPVTCQLWDSATTVTVQS